MAQTTSYSKTKYEYEGVIGCPIQLEGNKFYCISIPAEYVTKWCTEPYKISLLCYLLFHRTVVDTVTFSIKEAVAECGYFPKYGKNSINEKMINALREMCQEGFITINDYDNLDENTKLPPQVVISINYDKIKRKLQKEKFVVLYYDEFIKTTALGNNHTTTSMVLVTYLYLKMNIIHRKLEYNGYRYTNRDRYRTNNPEAYNDYYSVLGQTLEISRKNISVIVNNLVDANLLKVYQRVMPSSNSIKVKSPKLNKSPTIFVLPYKRMNGKEYESGQDYYEREAQNKLLKLNKRYKIKEKGGDEYELREEQ